jgi:hypothetical protein
MSEYPSQTQRTSPSSTSTLAVISLIAGIASWLFLPFVGAIAAIITGNMAKKEIRNSGGAVGGEGLAKAGVILGYANLALALLGMCIVAILLLLGPAIGGVFSEIVTEVSMI